MKRCAAIKFVEEEVALKIEDDIVSGNADNRIICPGGFWFSFTAMFTNTPGLGGGGW